MPYPPGVTLIPVRSGPSILMESGEDAITRMIVRASRTDMVWSASGTRLPQYTWVNTSLKGAEVELLLPATDQAGWVAGGAPLSSPTHTYQITVDMFREGIGYKLYRADRLVYNNVQVPESATYVDVDVLPYA